MGAFIDSVDLQQGMLKRDHRHPGGTLDDHPLRGEESLGDPQTDISAIKAFVPAAYERVVDRSIQVWGAAGVAGDLPLSGMYQAARTLRLADGPDDVHKILIAKNILKHPRLRGVGMGLRQLRRIG